MKIDIKDLKLGFWIGAGIALFSLVMTLLTWLTHRAVDRNAG